MTVPAVSAINNLPCGAVFARTVSVDPIVVNSIEMSSPSLIRVAPAAGRSPPRRVLSVLAGVVVEVAAFSPGRSTGPRTATYRGAASPGNDASAEVQDLRPGPSGAIGQRNSSTTSS
jgi:hypothetical protein